MSKQLVLYRTRLEESGDGFYQHNFDFETHIRLGGEPENILTTIEWGYTNILTDGDLPSPSFTKRPRRKEDE